MITKSPKDMNLTELQMLMEIRKLELKNSIQDVHHKLGIGARIFKAIQKSGIIESISDAIQGKPVPTRKSDSHEPKNPGEENSSKDTSSPSGPANP